MALFRAYFVFLHLYLYYSFAKKIRFVQNIEATLHFEPAMLRTVTVRLNIVRAMSEMDNCPTSILLRGLAERFRSCERSQSSRQPNKRARGFTSGPAYSSGRPQHPWPTTIYFNSSSILSYNMTKLNGAAEARRAHNPEDNGSKPFSAILFAPCCRQGGRSSSHTYFFIFAVFTLRSLRRSKIPP